VGKLFRHLEIRATAAVFKLVDLAARANYSTARMWLMFLTSNFPRSKTAGTNSLSKPCVRHIGNSRRNWVQSQYCYFSCFEYNINIDFRFKILA